MPKPGEQIVVSLSMVTTNEEHVTRAAEAMSRLVIGLALEGIDVSLSIGTVTDDDE